MMDSSEIIASCDVTWNLVYIIIVIEIKVNVCSTILTRFCAYTRPRYQVSLYRTISPLVKC